jgi:hypothetical protein
MSGFGRKTDIGLVSIGDLVKIHISEVEMEAAATREYAG